MRKLLSERKLSATRRLPLNTRQLIQNLSILLPPLQQSCSLDSSKSSQENLLSLKVQLLNLNKEKVQLSAQRYYDPEAQELVSCLLKTVFQQNDFPVAYQIRSWIKMHLRQSGAAGAILENAFFLLKSALKTDATYDGQYGLTAETLIGLKLNELRSSIPNFVYTHTGFGCSPLIQYQEKLVTWCSLDTYRNLEFPVRYLAIEKVENAFALNELLPYLSIWELLNIYLQLILSLAMANRKYQFVHYDLHTKNVLIRLVQSQPIENLTPRNFLAQEKKWISIPYETERGTLYLSTYFVAVIIDFGLSRMIVENRLVTGAADTFLDYGIDAQENWTYQDVYKLSNAIFGFRIDEEKKAYFTDLLNIVGLDRKLTNVYGYVDSRNPAARVKLMTFRYDSFLKRIRNTFELNFLTEKPAYPPFGCSLEHPCPKINIFSEPPNLDIREIADQLAYRFKNNLKIDDLNDQQLTIAFQEGLEQLENSLQLLLDRVVLDTSTGMTNLTEGVKSVDSFEFLLSNIGRIWELKFKVEQWLISLIYTSNYLDLGEEELFRLQELIREWNNVKADFTTLLGRYLEKWEIYLDRIDLEEDEELYADMTGLLNSFLNLD